VEYPGTVYHVMNRGDRREPSFKSDKDRELFISTLGEGCGKAGWEVHAKSGGNANNDIGRKELCQPLGLTP